MFVLGLGDKLGEGYFVYGIEKYYIWDTSHLNGMCPSAKYFASRLEYPTLSVQIGFLYALQ